MIPAGFLAAIGLRPSGEAKGSFDDGMDTRQLGPRPTGSKKGGGAAAATGAADMGTQPPTGVARAPEAVGFPAVLLALASIGTPLSGMPPATPDAALAGEPPVDRTDPLPALIDVPIDLDEELDVVVPLAVRDTVTLDRASLQNLSGDFVARLRRVADRMWNEHQLRVEVVEGYRSQGRQEDLFAQGRTEPGPVVTWTRSSRHTAGAAADLFVNGAPVSAERAMLLSRIAREEGLRTLYPYDSGHIQLDGGRGSEGPEAARDRPATPTTPVQTPRRGVAPVAPVARVARPAGTGMAMNDTPTEAATSPRPDASAVPTKPVDQAVSSTVAHPRMLAGNVVVSAGPEPRPTGASKEPPTPGKTSSTAGSYPAAAEVKTVAPTELWHGDTQRASNRDMGAQSDQRGPQRAVGVRVDRPAPGPHSVPDEPTDAGRWATEVSDGPDRGAGIERVGGDAGAPRSPPALTAPAAPSRTAAPTQSAASTLAPPTPLAEPLPVDAPDHAQAYRRLHLPIDGVSGSSLHVGIRAGTVDALLNVSDPILAEALRANLIELRQQLGDRGLDSGAIAVRLVGDAAGETSTRVAERVEVRGASQASGSGGGAESDGQEGRPRRTHDRSDPRDQNTRARQDREEESK